MSANQATTGRVRSSDVEIFYRKFGAPGRTPVLIVHGLSYFSYDWIDAGSRMAADREVVAIDMRGFGESGWSATRDYKLETLSNDVIAVIDALGWSKAVLMGHSFGGRVCLATAGWKPERAAGLVLVDFAPDIAAAGRRYLDPDLAPGIALAQLSGAASPVEVLTDKELAVFLKLAEGCSVGQVARAFCLSASTVGTHLYHIKQKLNVANGAQLALVAVRNGLIET
jgi:pimeloyl-ACP methyl ester carboxylesterase